jgi:cysteine desulfurase
MGAIYLDYNATTPIAPEVFEAMLPWLREHHGNPGSTHASGRRAARAVAEARASVAALIGADPTEIVFTGCATEADNLAVLGVAGASGGRHLVVSAIEHPAVLEPALELRRRGWGLTVLPVDSTGRVDPVAVAAALRTDTALVSVMHANNEVGTIQPVAEIAAITRARGVILHTDAAQSVGKLPIDVDALGIDLLTIAGHKFYAPKGIGALYVRAGTRLAPLAWGGGQERGLRPGTENVASIVALGAAARLAMRDQTAVTVRLRALRDELHARLAAAIPGLRLNGHPVERLPNTLHVSFPGVSGRALLAAVGDRIAASVGSACHSEHDQVSGVLAAMGADASIAAGAVRLSVGTPTTEVEVGDAASALAATWRGLMAAVS